MASPIDMVTGLITASFSYTDLLISDILIPILILIATPLAARIVDHAYFQIEKKKPKLIEVDATRQRMMRSLTRAAIYILGLVLLMYSIEPLRSLAVGAFAGVGIIGIVIGLAAQDTLSNLVAGLSLVTFKPFKLGDRLKVGDNEGNVEDITLRHTVIRDWQNNRIILPNDIVAKEALINYTITDPKVQEYMDIGISYDSSVTLARKILIQEAEKDKDIITEKDKTTGDLTSPSVAVREFGDSSVNLRLFFWAPSKSASFSIKYRLFERIKERFDREGVEIPFPYRTLIYKKDMPKPKA